eukprot:8991159-Pyramimonas_sp.AAC.1
MSPLTERTAACLPGVLWIDAHGGAGRHGGGVDVGRGGVHAGETRPPGSCFLRLIGPSCEYACASCV